MEFDRTKVYMAVNAAALKAGSKGYFADNVKALKEAVLTEDSVMFGEVEEIFAEFASCRFGIKDEAGAGLFYLVEEPEEKKLRAYKDTEEMKDDFVKRCNLYNGNPMYNPLIWIKEVEEDENEFLVARYSDEAITIIRPTGAHSLSLEIVFSDYVYLDGSPCGISEKTMKFTAERKLYTTEEAMKILGLKTKAGICKKVKRHGIHSVKQWRYIFFTDEMIDDLKNNRKPGCPKSKTEKKRTRKRRTAARKKKAQRYCWRVSVWNDDLCAYVVAKCGLTRKEADEFAAGKYAVKRPCWR